MKVLSDGSVTSPAGYLAGGMHAGIKASAGVPDFGVIISEREATVAAVFTTHALPSPSVTANKRRLLRGKARAVAVNSGNANAATGPTGLANAETTAGLLAARIGAIPDEVFVCSTGVIGVQLPMEKIAAAVPAVKVSHDGGHAFARAIMTTDTRPKEIAVEVECGGKNVTIAGCAKGAGMIHPNMATMLSFITTDGAAEGAWLQKALSRAVEKSFNAIDIDGDMSTNDSVIVLANGAAGNAAINGGPDGEAFETGLTAVCEHLAKSIVRDAEGATTLIEVVVEEAASEVEARKLARRIAASLMVKTAVHGFDPNWGRIIAAAGDAGVPLNLDNITIKVGDITVFKGEPLEFDREAAVEHLKGETVTLTMALGAGNAVARSWGCNLSQEYVTLNSVYTT